MKENMLLKSIETTRPTVVAWPSGEWDNSLERAFSAAGISMERPSNKRQLSRKIPVLNVLTVLARPSDVLDDVRAGGADGGFTGSDVLSEAGIPVGREVSPCSLERLPRTVVPLKTLDPDAPQPVVYAGLTPNAIRQRMTLEESVSRGVIYTSYPQLTRRWLVGLKQEVPIFNTATEMNEWWLQLCSGSTKIESRGGIVPRSGKVESAWLMNQENYAIVDISSTGETAEANSILPIVCLMQAALMLIRKPDEQISRTAQRNLADLLSMLQEAAETKGAQEPSTTIQAIQ